MVLEFGRKSGKPGDMGKRESGLATAEDLERQALQLESLTASLIEGERD